MVKLSASLEDYLEAIYQIISEKQSVKAIEVSRKLNVGRSSVTEALKNLAEKGFINYGRYDAISLTALGETEAKKIIQKHEALYQFFTQILCVSPAEAHENACKIEHVISEDVLNRLITFIQFNKQFHCQNHNYIEEFKIFLQK